jgi:hypothetical protein
MHKNKAIIHILSVLLVGLMLRLVYAEDQKKNRETMKWSNNILLLYSVDDKLTYKAYKIKDIYHIL